MEQIQKYLGFGRECLFPSSCPLCGCRLLDMDDAFNGVCSFCQQRLIREPGPYCKHCGRPLISESGLCMLCRNKERPVYDGIVSLFPYAGFYADLIKAYKFSMQRNLAHFFAEWIQRLASDLVEQYGPVDVLTPVPPQRGKKHKKGWDQMDYIADILAKKSRYPIQKTLVRLKSRSQKELNRSQRLTNLRGKILCTKKPAKTIILLDDVITTGTTLNTCAEVLKQAGACSVYAIALFYD